MDQNSIIQLVRSTAADEARQTEALVASKIELQTTLLKEELRTLIQHEVEKSLRLQKSDSFAEQLPTILAILRTPAARKTILGIALLFLGAGGAEFYDQRTDTPAVTQQQQQKSQPKQNFPEVEK